MPKIGNVSDFKVNQFNASVMSIVSSLFQFFQSDSTSLPVKVINKPTISNSLTGPATITTLAKKMVVRSPPQLTSFTTAKFNKTNIGSSIATKSETTDSKMVQIPMTEYLELVKQVNQVKELKDRLARLEEHCERSIGFNRNQTTTPH